MSDATGDFCTVYLFSSCVRSLLCKKARHPRSRVAVASINRPGLGATLTLHILNVYLLNERKKAEDYYHYKSKKNAAKRASDSSRYFNAMSRAEHHLTS